MKIDGYIQQVELGRELQERYGGNAAGQFVSKQRRNSKVLKHGDKPMIFIANDEADRLRAAYLEKRTQESTSVTTETREACAAVLCADTDMSMSQAMRRFAAAALDLAIAMEKHGG